MKRGRTGAETCALNGWKVGTRLVGDEGYGPTTIEITYLSDQILLAKVVDRHDKRRIGVESFWTLATRNWSEMPS